MLIGKLRSFIVSNVRKFLGFGRQNLDDTQKLDNGMMQTREGGGEQGHLL